MKVIYKDDNFLVVDKPAGLIVHAGAGETGPTLVDWILEKYPEMKKYDNLGRGMSPERVAVDRAKRGNRMAREPREKETSESWQDITRPGIVHRLDKDTSGLILVAKNPKTQKFFQEQFKNREIEKTYLALVLGKVEPKEGVIKSLISRDKNNRLKQKSTMMQFSWQTGKIRPAETQYKVINNYTYNVQSTIYYLSLLEVYPKTGRMHQIRVHLSSQGWPIVGDQVYNTKESRKVSDLLGLNRQFLHAYKLKIKNLKGDYQEFQSDLSVDLQKVIEKLK